jgi:hypothetical protein
MTSQRSTHRAALGAALVLAATLAASGSAAAQRNHAADNTPFDRLEVTVQDLDTGAMLGSIAPKDVAVINVGQRVRLQMLLHHRNGNVRPASTSYQPNQTNHIRVNDIDERAGTLTVTGLRPHGPQGAVPIVYHVLEGAPVPGDLRSARIYVKVAGDASTPVPPSQPVERGSVTFYRDEGFRGSSQQFFGDDDRLSDNPIGNDSISSLEIAPGCRVLLYRDEGFRGRVSEITTSIRSLDDTEVGNDAVSSFRLECGGGGGGGGRGLTLYSDENFRGSNETFLADDIDLADNRALGNDRASSARVDNGCEAWLYEDRHFAGASVYLTGDVPGLDRTVLGNDRASSVRVRCR